MARICFTTLTYHQGVNKSSDDDESDEEEFAGFSSAEKGKGRAIQEYEDEEQLATVTVVEEFDPESLRHMPSSSRHNPSDPPDSDKEHSTRASSDPRNLRRGAQHTMNDYHKLPPITSDSTASSKKTKIKPKKIAYETKAARKATRLKQRARKAQKAEIAGGKSNRKAKGKVGKKVRR